MPNIWWKKRTPELDEAVIATYKTGLDTYQTGAIHNISQMLVRRILIAHDIPRRSRRRFTDEQAANLAERYKAGINGNRLARENGTTGSTVYSALVRAGATIRSPSEFRTSCSANHDAFDDAENNPEAAYWVGMMMTDGCVFHNRSGTPVIRLALQNSDMNHMEAFRKFLNSTHKLCISKPKKNRNGSTTGPQVSLSVTSRRMGTALARYGVVPRKSLVACVRLLMRDPHFWRGALDGDGSVLVNTKARPSPSISLVGSLALCTQFSAFVKDLCPRCKAIVHPHKSIWHFRANGHHAETVVAALYLPGFIALPRKAARAQVILDRAKLSAFAASP